MNFFFRKIKSILKKGKFTPNDKAARIIRRFVDGTGSAYEWDDFETVNEENPEVDLAIQLCWYFAAKYPPRNSSEYCAKEADVYFLKIADALEKGYFVGLNHEQAKREIKEGALPNIISKIL